MSIRAVIFDFGGVLVRTEDPAPRDRLAERLGLTSAELSRIIYEGESATLATVGQVTTAAHWEVVRQRLQLAAEELTKVPLEFWGGDQLDEELMRFLRALRPRFKTALLSNAWDDLRLVIEERWKIADAFDEIFISAEVGLAKPDPRVYRLVLDKLIVEPEEAIFVDDFPENVEAARALGMQAIRFRDRDQVLEELRKILEA
jgi:epoxide hydrolase-like predicted phosphatase